MERLLRLIGGVALLGASLPSLRSDNRSVDRRQNLRMAHLPRITVGHGSVAKIFSLSIPKHSHGGCFNDAERLESGTIAAYDRAS
jgi:hypothetical protein